jgi:predicted nuclease of predicted toxin-antitoxin system
LAKLKVDENLPADVAATLARAGHDVATVLDQGMGGAPDTQVADRCQTEGRAIVTLDADFADIRSYPPHDFPGLVVLRLKRQDKPHVLEVCERLGAALSSRKLEGTLWIVEGERIRIRGDENPE